MATKQYIEFGELVSLVKKEKGLTHNDSMKFLDNYSPRETGKVYIDANEMISIPEENFESYYPDGEDKDFILAYMKKKRCRELLIVS